MVLFFSFFRSQHEEIELVEEEELLLSSTTQEAPVRNKFRRACFLPIYICMYLTQSVGVY